MAGALDEDHGIAPRARPAEAPCPACGAYARRPHYRGLRLDGRPTALHLCARCGAGYISPRRVGAELLRQYVDRDEQERYYREEYAPILPGVVRQTRRTIRLLEAFQKPGTLLDYGSGAAPVAAAAELAGWRAIGYDVSPVAAEYGRRMLGTRVLERWEDVARSALAPFDAVAMIEVIEHLEHPLATLRHALSVLRPGGVLAISTPNLASLARLRRGPRWEVIHPAAHILYLTPAVLRRMLLACGAQPLQVLTWGNEIGRLPLPRLWLGSIGDPPGGHALLAFARKR